jgi:hypothetical protein
MGKLSTHTHECPCCGAKWECGEANYQDECPYPNQDALHEMLVQEDAEKRLPR